MKKDICKQLWILIILSQLMLLSTDLSAQPGAHDPSSIITDGTYYYVFCTGDGIVMYRSSDPDFSSWIQMKSPFADGDPGWISNYVSGFKGFYWAPQCIYMNNEYYLYYSVSMGQRPCAIGVATSPSLSSPVWTDQGMIEYSDDNTAYGSIDPDVFFDHDGKLWLAYGSHLNGIVVAQLNTSTGKPLNSTRYNIAKPSENDAEAAFLLYNNGYYYVFYNRLICCNGYESSYSIFMGRSTNVTGPYLDKNGVSLTDGSSGSLFLQTDGRYIGPGHFGFDCSKLTYHFYDGNDNGAPKLAVSTLSWSVGWPVAATLTSGGDQVAAGTYTFTNVNSKKVLDLKDCSSLDGANVQQWENLNNTCQQWIIASTSNGWYTIKNVNSGKMLDVYNGGFANGTNVDQWPGNGLTAQEWSFYKSGDSYRIVSRCNGKDLEVQNALTTDGANVGTWAHNGNACQYWLLSSNATAVIDRTTDNHVSKPVIAISTIRVNDNLTGSTYKIYSINGAVVLQGTLQKNFIDIRNLSKGAYYLSIQSSKKDYSIKFMALH